MSFEERARKLYERKDFVRALVVLVEGLKRHPERAESLDFLLRIYTEECDNPGLERDILDALVRQPDCGSLVGQVCARLELRGKQTMLRALVQQTRERRVEIIWPPPPVEPEPQPEIPQPDNADTPDVTPSPKDPHTSEAAQPDPPAPSPSLQSPSTSQELQLPQPSDSLHIAASVPLLRADISAELQAAPSADVSTERRLFIQNDNITSRPNRASRSRLAPNRTTQGRADNKKPDSSAPASLNGPRKAAIASITLIVVLLIGLGLYRWEDMRVTSHVSRLDAMLIQFDPENSDAFEDALQKAINATVGESRALIERQNFARAVTDSESGSHDEPHQPTGLAEEPSTQWGAGALVLDAIKNNNIERALSETVTLEFTYPNSLTALWIRARLMEHMGDHKSAQTKYEETIQQYPDFIPAYLGLARLAARNFDVQRWNQALESLRKINTEHPFLQLKLEPALDQSLLSAPTSVNPDSEAEGRRIRTPVRPEEHGHFYAALRNYNLALEALADDDFAVAWGRAEDAVTSDPELRIARILLGALQAIAEETELASHTFTTAASAQNTFDNPSTKLRLLIQHIAPLSLTAAGRPDLALTFITPVAESPTDLTAPQPSALDELLASQQTKRPAFLEIPAADFLDTHPTHAQNALLARAYTLNALGAGKLVLEGLPDTNDDSPYAHRAALERVIAHIVLNQRQRARRQIDSMQESTEKHTAEAILAHLEGRFTEAAEHGNTAYTAQPHDHRALRPLVLSLIESAKGREAITTLEQASLAPLWLGEKTSLRIRVHARMGMRDIFSADLLNRLNDGCEPAELYSLNQQIDLIAATLWLRQNACAKERINSQTTTPVHPEWMWTTGLYFRSIGEGDRAAALFKKSWRNDHNNPELLVELGSVHLDFERYELAQEAFYAAILRDRGNIEALRGISRTYLAYDRPRGRRDLARMLSNLGSAPHYGPQRAELLKWIAVLHGLREGTPEALPYIEQAQLQVGERADLLIERARYHEARQEFAIARLHYANAVQKNSTMPDAHYGLAQMAIHAGDHRVASDHLKRFIALTPAGKKQSQAQAQLLQIQKKPGQ